MKYVIVCESASRPPECRSFAATEEEAARKLEESLASINGDGAQLKLYALEEVSFQVEHVPSVTLGEGNVFEGFGPSSPYEHLIPESETDGNGTGPDVAEDDVPPATTIDGEPVGDAEVFTFEA